MYQLNNYFILDYEFFIKFTTVDSIGCSTKNNKKNYIGKVCIGTLISKLASMLWKSGK